MERCANNWEFDASHLLIRNRMTGKAVPLRDVDTPEALLQTTLHLASADRPGEDARGFTDTLRHACHVMFHSSLRDVYCCPDRTLRRVDWQHHTAGKHS